MPHTTHKAVAVAGGLATIRPCHQGLLPVCLFCPSVHKPQFFLHSNPLLHPLFYQLPTSTLSRRPADIFLISSRSVALTWGSNSTTKGKEERQQSTFQVVLLCKRSCGVVLNMSC